MRYLLTILLLIPILVFGQVKRYPFYKYVGTASDEYINYLAWYQFVDYTDEGGTHDGTNYGASISSERLHFPASDGGDYVELPAGILPSGIDTFTISLRFYLDETQVDENYYLMGDAVRNTADDGFYVFLDNASGNDIFNVTSYVQHADNTRDYVSTGIGGSCQSILAGDTWYHLIMIYYYATANSARWISWVDGVYCANAGDSVFSKALVQDGSTLLIGNEKTLNQGFREGDMIDDLMFFEGDLRTKYPGHNYIDDLITDPTKPPILQ